MREITTVADTQGGIFSPQAEFNSNEQWKMNGELR